MSISEKIVHSTIRIEAIDSNGNVSTGSGFFFNFLDEGDTSVPTIVTNKHVVDGSLKGNLRFTYMTNDGKPDFQNFYNFEVGNFENQWIKHPNPTVDLCAMPIAGLLEFQKKQTGEELFYIPLDKSLIMDVKELSTLTALEDIIMVGYPNGIWDSVNNLPILRKGITATNPKIHYNGKAEFLIDAACFPGSSGSPVFLLNEGSYKGTGGGIVIGNRVKLLGILYAGPQHTTVGDIIMVKVPTISEPKAVTSIPNNLGYVIMAKELLVLENEIKRILNLL